MVDKLIYGFLVKTIPPPSNHYALLVLEGDRSLDPVLHASVSMTLFPKAPPLYGQCLIAISRVCPVFEPIRSQLVGTGALPVAV